MALIHSLLNSMGFEIGFSEQMQSPNPIQNHFSKTGLLKKASLKN